MVRALLRRFTPDVLSEVMSASLGTQALEITAIKTALFLVSAPQLPLMDLVAFTGYKYVGCVLTTLVGLLGVSLLYYACLVYTGVCMVSFMLNTLKASLPPSGGGGGEAQKRNFLLLGCARARARAAGPSVCAYASHNPALPLRRRRRPHSVSLLQFLLMWWLSI